MEYQKYIDLGFKRIDLSCNVETVFVPHPDIQLLHPRVLREVRRADGAAT